MKGWTEFMSPTAHAIIYTLIALALLGTAGNIACKGLFWATRLQSDPPTTSDNASAGRVIGWLERSMLAAGIISGSLEIFAAVIALKTVARFKELDNQATAEYFLVGSLFSLLWALFITGAWLAYDRHIGENVNDDLRTIIAPTDAPDNKTRTCPNCCTGKTDGVLSRLPSARPLANH